MHVPTLSAAEFAPCRAHTTYALSAQLVHKQVPFRCAISKRDIVGLAICRIPYRTAPWMETPTSKVAMPIYDKEWPGKAALKLHFGMSIPHCGFPPTAAVRRGVPSTGDTRRRAVMRESRLDHLNKLHDWCKLPRLVGGDTADPKYKSSAIVNVGQFTNAMRQAPTDRKVI